MSCDIYNLRIRQYMYHYRNGISCAFQIQDISELKSVSINFDLTIPKTNKLPKKGQNCEIDGNSDWFITEVFNQTPGCLKDKLYELDVWAETSVNLHKFHKNKKSTQTNL